MARRLRIEFAGAIYHVLNRGDRREAIFIDDEDRRRFIATLAETCGKTTWQVHAFCLMPNHFHLVVETPEANLVAGMKWLLGTYTTRFNRRHKMTGHLFAGRYKSTLVGSTGDYLQRVCDYVHLNPVRAGLLPEGTPLQAFTWSSYPDYLAAPVDRPAWLRVDRVLEQLGLSHDRPIGRQRFGQRMETLRTHDLEGEFLKLRRAWCYGDEWFRKDLALRLEAKPRPHHYGSEIRESAQEKANRLVEEELERLGWQWEDLASARKGDSRKLAIACRLREESTVSLEWIANRLQMGTRGYLAHLLYWRTRRGPNPLAPEQLQASRPRSNQGVEFDLTQQFDPSFD